MIFLRAEANTKSSKKRCFIDYIKTLEMLNTPKIEIENKKLNDSIFNSTVDEILCNNRKISHFKAKEKVSTKNMTILKFL